MQFTTSGSSVPATSTTTTNSSLNQPKNTANKSLFGTDLLHSPPLISLPQKSTGFSTQTLIPNFPPPWPHNFSNPPPRIPRFPAGIPRPGNAIFAANPRLAQQHLNGFSNLTDMHTINNNSNANNILNVSITNKNTSDSTSSKTRNASTSLNDVPLPNEEFKTVFKTGALTLSTEKDLGMGPSSSAVSKNFENNSIPSLVSNNSSSLEINNQFGFLQQDLTQMPRTCKYNFIKFFKK